MKYIKSLNEQKIKPQEFKPELGYALSKREKSILDETLSNYEVVHPRFVFKKIYVDDYQYYLYVNIFDERESSHRRFYYKFDGFNEMLSYIKLYLKIPTEEYVRILEKYKFGYEDFPRGYSNIILRHFKHKKLYDIFSIDLYVTDKIRYLFEINSYSIDYIKKDIKNNYFIDDIYQVLLKYDFKSAIELYMEKKIYSDLIASYVLTHFDEDLFKDILTRHKSKLIRYICSRNNISDEVILKIYPFICDFQTNDRFIRSYIDAVVKEGNNQLKIEIIQSPKLKSFITIDILEKLFNKKIIDLIKV